MSVTRKQDWPIYSWWRPESERDKRQGTKKHKKQSVQLFNEAVNYFAPPPPPPQSASDRYCWVAGCWGGGGGFCMMKYFSLDHKFARHGR